VILSVSLLCALPLGAANVDASAGIAFGLRTDAFDWNEGEDPVWESVLEWEDLQIWEFSIGGQVFFENFEGRGAWFAASLASGSINGGENSDRDYIFGSLTDESYSDVGGDVADSTIEGGYRFPLTWRPADADVSLIVLLGYSYHQMNLDDEDLRVTEPFGYTFSGNVSTYDAEWSGPYLGAHILIDYPGQFNLYGRLTYHIADFEAVADWILREDFAHPVSFEHDADGHGLVFRIGGTRELTQDLSLNVAITLQSWLADSGTDRTYFAAGGSVDIDLHEVNWVSRGLTAGLAYRF
jgi:hypothetical protein